MALHRTGPYAPRRKRKQRYDASAGKLRPSHWLMIFILMGMPAWMFGLQLYESIQNAGPVRVLTTASELGRAG